MKISDYLIIKKHDIKDCYIAVNSLSGCVDYISNSVGENLTSNNLENISGDISEYLIGRGYIVAKGSDEKTQLFKIADIIHSNNVKKYRLSIVPTMSCNFACPYCFEDSSKARGKLMSETDIDEIFDAVDSADLPFSPDVFLFGGEPLMKENKKIISHIVEHCKKRGMRLYGPTNGYDLDAYKELLGPDQINNLQISIDGLFEQHDVSRKHKNGSKTFQKIVDNIDYCLKNNVKVIARSNLSGNDVSVIEKLIQFYEKKGWIENENFSYAFSPIMYSEENLTYKKFYDKIKNIGIAEHKLLHHVSQYLGIMNKLEKLIENGKLVLFQPEMCAACYNGFFVAPDKKLYTCGDLLQSELSCGELVKGTFVFNNSRDDWNSRYITNMSKCTKCAYALFCGGGCPVRGIRNNISITTSMCWSFPDIFDKCLSNICNNKIPQNV